MADEEVVLHRARLSVASGLRQAVTLADSGRYEEADSVLAERIAELDNLMVQVLLLATGMTLRFQLVIDGISMHPHMLIVSSNVIRLLRTWITCAHCMVCIGI